MSQITSDKDIGKQMQFSGTKMDVHIAVVPS